MTFKMHTLQIIPSHLCVIWKNDVATVCVNVQIITV